MHTRFRPAGWFRSLLTLLFASGILGGVPRAAAAETAKAGYIIGSITRPDGSPIGIAGATFTLTINGVAGQGEDVQFQPKVKTDGTFSLRVPSGIYHAATARIRVPFDGTFYTYPLVPTTMLDDSASAPGIVADFVWKTNGPTPLAANPPNPANLTDWFGGCCDLAWDQSYTDAQGHNHDLPNPTGGKFTFTATANGKLIDGSPARTVTYQLVWDSLAGILPAMLNDLPPALGGWHITGTLVRADGTTEPLSIRIYAPTEKYAPSVEVKITPPPVGSMLGANPTIAPGLIVMEQHG